jgi:hypothetical protein
VHAGIGPPRNNQRNGVDPEDDGECPLDLILDRANAPLPSPPGKPSPVVFEIEP